MSSRVRVSTLVIRETRSNIRDSVAQDSPSLVEDTGLLRATIFVCASDALYETPLRFDTVEG